MVLSHLALTVIEDPAEDGRYHWLLLEPGSAGDVQEYAASGSSFASTTEAFEAGAVRWRAELNTENEDADPVGDIAEP